MAHIAFRNHWGVDLSEMKAMLQWEAEQDGDRRIPDPSDDFMTRWLDTNSASKRNIQERIYNWKKATDNLW